MDDLEQFVDEAGKMLEIIAQREARAKAFVEQLAEELMDIATKYYPEIETIDPEKKEKIAYKAFYRAKELNDFMFKRIYDGKDDLDEDIARYSVPPLHDEEGNKLKLEAKLKMLPTEYHDAYTEVFYEGLEADKHNNEFLYDCFESAKLSLWVAFPEIAELSGNSILLMNWQAFSRMKYFIFDLSCIIW
jgi:uncharacterized protein YdcH (DUF465 family)